jgi:holin-like protein
MLKALFYLFLFLIMGELILNLIDIPISGNILGMILIFIALKLKLIKLETVKPATDILIKYMVLFFVPYGVGLMSYFAFLKANWIVLTIAVGLSTLITLYVTAIIQQKLENHD